MSTIPPVTKSMNRIRRFEDLVFQIGRNLLGTGLLLTGIAMTLTLILLPVGIPVTLVGIAMLLGSDETF